MPAVRAHMAQVTHHAKKVVAKRRDLLRAEHVGEDAEAFALEVSDRHGWVPGRSDVRLSITKATMP